MEIYITSGTGSGPTSLAAFDAAAMMAAGVNHNMIYLSSFIPSGSVVKRDNYVMPTEQWGQRVYVVMARADAGKPGEEAWAGIGWMQDASGRGMFVEHCGTSKGAVHDDIHATLEFMKVSRGMSFGPVEYEIVGVRCEKEPACAVAVAVYEVERWKSFRK